MTQVQHEEKAIIEELISARYPVTLATFASRLGCTDIQAARKLPDGRCAFVRESVVEEFDEFWQEMASWQKVTLFIVHDGHVFEIATRLTPGKKAQGYYNILHRDAVVGGHIRYGDIGSIAFVDLPFMGRESLSVQFFNRKGSVVFSVYVGRENHQLIESVRDAFFRARERFCQ